MNMMKIFSLIFVSGCLVLPVINTHAKEAPKSQKIVSKDLGHPVQYDTEAVNVADFTDNLFPGYAENDIVYQVNGGGFLSSTTEDAKTLKQGFEKDNPGVKLKAVTVSEAKEYYKKQLNKHLPSPQKEQ